MCARPPNDHVAEKIERRNSMLLCRLDSVGTRRETPTTESALIKASCGGIWMVDRKNCLSNFKTPLGIGLRGCQLSGRVLQR